MQRDKTYQYVPEEDKSRLKISDVLGFFYDFESCYTNQMLILRERIISHRRYADFHEHYQHIKSWFNEDLSSALENVNQDRFFLSPRLKPRESVIRDDFYARSKNVGKFSWDSLHSLERKVANYLLLRNQNIQESHLNEPLNFFYLDLKEIIRKIASEPSPESAKKVLISLLNYIRRVEAELSVDSNDRIFVNELGFILRKKIIPEMTVIIETQSLYKSFEVLERQLKDLVYSSVGVTHFAYQDKKVSPHPMRLDESISVDERAANPTQGLIDCVDKGRDAVVKGKLLENKKGMSRYYRHLSDINEDVNKKNIKQLLEDCHEIDLMVEASNEDKESYIDAVMQTNKLNRYHQLVKRIIKLFEDAGQYNTVIYFRDSLKKFLKSLLHELELTRGKIELVIENNDALKHRLLREKRSTTLLSRFFYKNDDTRLSLFFSNQDLQNKLQDLSEGIQGFSEAGSQVEKISRFIENLSSQKSIERAESQVNSFVARLYEDINSLSYFDGSSDFNDGMIDFDLVNLNQNAWSICRGSDHTISMFSKNSNDFDFGTQSINEVQSNRVAWADNYRLESCQLAQYKQLPAVYCEGEKSLMFYQAMTQQGNIQFISEVASTIQLGLVAFRIVVNGTRWLFSTSINNQESMKSGLGFFFRSAPDDMLQTQELPTTNSDQRFFCDILR